MLELSEADDDVPLPKLARAVRTAPRAGFRVALDDFGVAGASLGRLQALPVDVVRLDGSLVAGLTAEPLRGWPVVESIIRLASALGAEVVAEGVEEAAQLSALVELGCGMAQGYLLHRPEPLDLDRP